MNEINLGKLFIDEKEKSDYYENPFFINLSIYKDKNYEGEIGYMPSFKDILNYIKETNTKKMIFELFNANLLKPSIKIIVNKRIIKPEITFRKDNSVCHYCGGNGIASISGLACPFCGCINVTGSIDKILDCYGEKKYGD